MLLLFSASAADVGRAWLPKLVAKLEAICVGKDKTTICIPCQCCCFFFFFAAAVAVVTVVVVVVIVIVDST